MYDVNAVLQEGETSRDPATRARTASLLSQLADLEATLAREARTAERRERLRLVGARCHERLSTESLTSATC